MAHLLHQGVDLRPAAVNENGPHTHIMQQGDVLHHLRLERFVNHGVAAVFHHNRLAGKLFKVRQGFNQHIGMGGGVEYRHKR